MHLLVFSDAVSRRQRQFLSQVLLSTGFRTLDVTSIPLNEEAAELDSELVSCYDTVIITMIYLITQVEEKPAETVFQLITFSCPVHQNDYDKLMSKFKGDILGLLHLSFGTRFDGFCLVHDAE